MSGECAMSRQACGEDTYGTLNSTALTIAFMEFLSDSDSNAMKSLWLSHGWQDISPFWGHKKLVPSFKKDAAMVAQWPDFQSAMADVEADWFYLSGHHGRQYSSDLGADEDMVSHFNTHDRCGFFNHVYHDGRWEHDSQEDPYAHVDDLDVFMKTGAENFGSGFATETNTLYWNEHSCCRGIFLVGCRALAYKAARRMYTKYFPNAVVIGPVSREANAITKLLKVCQSYGREFFVDPRQFDPEEVCKKLNPVSYAFDQLGVLRDGEFWFPIGKNKIRYIAAEDDITDDIP